MKKLAVVMLICSAFWGWSCANNTPSSTTSGSNSGTLSKTADISGLAQSPSGSAQLTGSTLPQLPITPNCNPAMFGNEGAEQKMAVSGGAFFSDYICPTSGTAKDIQVYMSASNYVQILNQLNILVPGISGVGQNQTQVAIYTADSNGNPDVLLATSNFQAANTNPNNQMDPTTWPAQWVTFNLTGNPLLTAGTKYCLCLLNNFDLSLYTPTLPININPTTTTPGPASYVFMSNALIPAAQPPAYAIGGVKEVAGLKDLSTVNSGTPQVVSGQILAMYVDYCSAPIVGTPLQPTLPQLPITANCNPATFGNEGAEQKMAVSGGAFFSDYICPTSGTAKDIQVYMSASNYVQILNQLNILVPGISGVGQNQTQVAIYTADSNGNPDVLLATSNFQAANTNPNNQMDPTTWPAQWVTFNLTGNPLLTAGTKYCLCLLNNFDLSLYTPTLPININPSTITPGPASYVFMSNALIPAAQPPAYAIGGVKEVAGVKDLSTVNSGTPQVVSSQILAMYVDYCSTPILGTLLRPSPVSIVGSN